MTKQPNFQLKAGTTPELFIYDEIGPTWANMVSAETVIAALREVGNAKNLVLRINSPGGDVFEAAAIYNAIKRHGGYVSVKIDGLAASAASHIMLAGDEIEIAANAFVMIHNAWTVSMGNANDLEHTAEVLRKIDGSLVDAYAERTGEPVTRIRAWMDAETWFNADEATRYGFADTIGSGNGASASVPSGRYRNTPAALTGGKRTSLDELIARNKEIRERNDGTAYRREVLQKNKEARERAVAAMR